MIYNQFRVGVHLALLASLVHGDNDCSNLIAQTENGLVRGLCLTSEGGNKFGSFRGIPYAKPPIGERRYVALEPLEPWDGVVDASKEGPICPQNTTIYEGILDTSNMSEDCIYVNIHVPFHALPDYAEDTQECRGALNELENPGLPVLVFYHGGGLTAGSGGADLHGPEYMIDEDVIIITFNYRIDSFGFLFLDTPSVPGNNGIRDAITLLKWVQANVKYFGGDPDNVTLGGQSLGAVAIQLLTLSNAAVGLFKRAILMSGIATRGYLAVSPENARNIAKKFVTSLNITSTDPEDILRQLNEKPLKDIMAATDFVRQEIGSVASLFGPVIETQFSQPRVLDDEPVKLMESGRGNQIPLLVGFTNNDGKFFEPIFKESDVVGIVNKKALAVLSPNIVFQTSNTTAIELVEIMKKRYFSDGLTTEKYARIFTEMVFKYAPIYLVQRRASIGGAAAFLYEFTYHADFSSIAYTKNITYCGATHDDDLIRIFKTNALNGVKGFSPQSPRDSQMTKQMMGYFKNFMTCSKPICKETSDKQWPPVSPTEVLFQLIQTPGKYQVRGLTNYLKDIVKFFDYLYSFAQNN